MNSAGLPALNGKETAAAFLQCNLTIATSATVQDITIMATALRIQLFVPAAPYQGLYWMHSSVNSRPMTYVSGN
jgi:hypothetical protein